MKYEKVNGFHQIMLTEEEQDLIGNELSINRGIHYNKIRNASNGTAKYLVKVGSKFVSVIADPTSPKDPQTFYPDVLNDREALVVKKRLEELIATAEEN